MSTKSRRYSTLKLLGAVAAMCLGASVAMAQDAPKPAAPAPAAPAPADPNTGKISLTAGVDFVTHYFFRGLAQENQGFIMQPYAGLTFNLFESDGPVNNISFTFGTWNSLHSGPTGADSTNPALGSPDLWYESDFYAGLSSTLLEDWTASVTYTAYMSPNSSFNSIQEIAAGLGYNDKKLLGDFALNPSILVAFEVQDEADTGNSLFGLPDTDEGVYFQLGLKPSFTLIESEDFPVSLAIPVTLGLSLDDYYEDGSGEDETFGYVDVGFDFSIPLAFIPSDYGSWSLTAGPHLIWMGQNSQEFATPNPTNGDDFAVWGKLGISVTY